MSPKASAVRASELAEQVRREVPAVGEAEAELRIVLARNVLRLRNRRGMTQRDLARALGVSQPRIAEIEGARTRRASTPSRSLRLCSAWSPGRS